jgi:ABC-2 type transport system permease protein
MSRRNAFGQLILARIREFYREPEVIFWVYGFPLVLATILGIAFSSSAPAPPLVDVELPQDADLETTARAKAIVAILAEAKITATLESAAKSRQRFKRGKSDLIIMPQATAREYVYDPARDKSVLARYWVDSVLTRTELGKAAPAVQESILSEPGSRYIDFLLPGLIGMNIMGGGLFGVGFVLVDMRARKLFKRLMATPMHRGDFLFSMLTSRMLFLFP